MREICELIWPPRTPESVLNPDAIFGKYYAALVVIDQYIQRPSPFAHQLLQGAIHVFEHEEKRRDTIEKKAGQYLGLGLVSMLIAVHQFLQTSSESGEWGKMFIGILIVTYLTRAVINAYDVFKDIQRYCIGPDDLIVASGRLNSQIYEVGLARHYLAHTIENYKINNRQFESLVIAQLCSRNAIIISIGLAIFPIFPKVFSSISSHPGIVSIIEILGSSLGLTIQLFNN